MAPLFQGSGALVSPRTWMSTACSPAAHDVREGIGRAALPVRVQPNRTELEAEFHRVVLFDHAEIVDERQRVVRVGLAAAILRAVAADQIAQRRRARRSALAADPGIATVPVKLTANALVSTPGMSGVKPLIRVLLPLKPSLVSLTTLGVRICFSVYTTFCGTPVTIWPDPVTSSGWSDSPDRGCSGDTA